MKNHRNITVVIVTYRTNEKILRDCLNTINKDVQVLITENSKNFKNKEKFESIYKNVKIITSGSNLGYGGGNNFGIEQVDSRYALILNPDVILDDTFFDNIDEYLEESIDFNIIGVKYKKNLNHKTSGSFEEFDKRIKIDRSDDKNKPSLEVVDWVVGCAMLIDLKNFKNRKIFDENFFLYFEEFDLCRRVKQDNGKIFSSNKLFIEHLGNRGSSATDPDYSLETEVFRNWHWMWSTFYYFRKYYGYNYALYKTYGKLFRALFKMVLFSIFYNKKKQTIYYARAFGIINAMIGKKSWYRVKSLFQ